MRLLRGQEWNQFERSVRMFLEHADWYALLNGLIWGDDTRTPEPGQTVSLRFRLRGAGKGKQDKVTVLVDRTDLSPKVTRKLDQDAGTARG
jgi:hypothetical protein